MMRVPIMIATGVLSATMLRVSADPAQSGSVGGIVVGPGDQRLPGVIVTALPESGGLAKRTTSGSDGTFRIDGLPGDTCRVDFDLGGFVLIRRNRIRIGDETLKTPLTVRPVCECVNAIHAGPLRERAGQVVDEAGSPLPHARLEIITKARREVAYADNEGHFRIRLSLKERWPLTASDTGFEPNIKQVSGDSEQPIRFRLARMEGSTPPDIERLGEGCGCPYLFSQAAR